MNRGILIILSGPIAAGKSTLAGNLRGYGFQTLSTRDYIRGTVGEENPDRFKLQEAGEALDKRYPEWTSDWVHGIFTGDPSARVVLDSIRDIYQADSVRKLLPPSVRVFHIHLQADTEELRERFERRPEASMYERAKAHGVEARIASLAQTADLVVHTDRSEPREVHTRIANWIGLGTPMREDCVDVLVGGQYGSEGKGHVVAYLAPEYDTFVRVGGPNAGHTVIWDGAKHSFYHLPSGTLHSPHSKLILGAGAVINPNILMKEIDSVKKLFGLDISTRLRIDHRAAVITQEDIEAEAALVGGIGSTGQGVGYATAAKILYRNAPRKRAEEYPELAPYICDTHEELAHSFASGDRTLLEGTQGTGLSLHHGPYPYVTSRETTAGGCLAESGIATSRVRKIVMVVRTNPIRVASPSGGTSGPMAKEIDWDVVASRSGEPEDVLREREKTTTTKRLRRVSEFDWGLLAKSAFLNGPTDIALTFADYITKSNQDARRFEQLSPETHDLVREIEQTAKCPVTLITTRFHQRSIIDRRSWR